MLRVISTAASGAAILGPIGAGNARGFKLADTFIAAVPLGALYAICVVTGAVTAVRAATIGCRMTRRATGIFRHGNEASGEADWVIVGGTISYPPAPAQASQMIAAVSDGDGERGE